MGNVHIYKQHFSSQSGDMSAALGAETSDKITTPVFVYMKNYDLVRAVGQVSNVVSTHAISLKMYEATTTAGAGSQSLTHAQASDTYTSAASTTLDILEAQTRGEDLTSGYGYVGAILSTNDGDGTEVASLHLECGRARYKQSTMPSMTA